MRYVCYAASLPLKIVWAALVGFFGAIVGTPWSHMREDAVKWFAIPN